MCTTRCSVRISPRRSSCLQHHILELTLMSPAQMKPFLWITRCSHFARVSVHKVNGRSGIGQVDEHLALFLLDWDEHTVSACEKMGDDKVSVLDETRAKLRFEGMIFQLLWKIESVHSVVACVFSRPSQSSKLCLLKKSYHQRNKHDIKFKVFALTYIDDIQFLSHCSSWRSD